MIWSFNIVFMGKLSEAGLLNQDLKIKKNIFSDECRNINTVLYFKS